MTKDDFYKKISDLLPIKRTDENFLNAVESVYTQYLSDINSIEEKAFGTAEAKTNTIKKVTEAINTVKSVINTFLQSSHSEAYTLLKTKIANSDGSLNLGVITIKPFTDTNMYYYRARMDDNKINTFKDMFHVPNNKRGLIKTTRFSAPGYPCLYLGNTIYDCWEEMRRPKFDSLCFSGYKVVKEFKVYDLIKPSKDCFDKSLLSDVLERLVYIIVCQFTVLNDGDYFKPEYIIPQLIIELIITSNKKLRTDPDSLLWGVAFTSTHLATDFIYKEEYLTNIAIPVVDTTDIYCSYLSSLFEISDPIRYRYEELKEKDSLSWGKIDEDEIRNKYNDTKMGYLEHRLNEDITKYNKPSSAIV